MYNEDVKNESCETRQRRRVAVVTSEKYYLFREPLYLSNHGIWKEPYADYDVIMINGENKYVTNLIKPFDNLDDILIAYRKITDRTGEYNIESLKDIIGEYYVIYDSLRTDCKNEIKIPYHLNEGAIFEKILNRDESVFKVTFVETDYHKEKVIVNAKDLFKFIKDQKIINIKSDYKNDKQKIDNHYYRDPKGPSSKEMNGIDESVFQKGDK